MPGTLVPARTVRYHHQEATMRRIRVEQKQRRPREDRAPVLPSDPRDPDVVRAKRVESVALRDKRL